MKRNTEDIWRRRVEEFRASGKTGRAFAREKGFHETTLSHYLQRFAAETGAAVKTVTLARVQREPRAASATGEKPDRAVEIVAGGGHVVRVRKGFDEDVLRSVLRVVEEGR